MGDHNLRVWPVEGDGYGEVIEYPRYAKYRKEPHYPGATGDANHDLVMYEKVGGKENELGRHAMGDILIAYAGESTPTAVAQYFDEKSKGSTTKSSRKAGTATNSK